MIPTTVHPPHEFEGRNPPPTPETAKVSVVVPVRNGQRHIAQRIASVIAILAELGASGAEIVVVDDGSRDSTPAILDQLCIEHSRLRVLRHDRARGLEAAGQTGLERSTGDLIFIQESDGPLLIADIRRLMQVAKDPTVVAARVETTAAPLSEALVRRLRGWGINTDRQAVAPGDGPTHTLQLIRRPHLHSLAGPRGDRFRLEGQTTHATRLDTDETFAA